MEVVQHLTGVQGVIWFARATVLRLAVVLTGWTYTLMVAEVPPQLLQPQVLLPRLRRPAVILCLDGLSWDAIQITYLDVHCQ
jgi:hypothetical protein